MTRIYLIRHGATGLSEKKQKVSDGLNSDGREMVRALARRLVKEGIVKMYVSPYLRARQSAQLINNVLHVPLEQRTELREVALFKSPLELRNPWLKKEYQAAQKVLSETWPRLDVLMQDVLGEHQGKTVAWVAHGNLIRVILAGALQWPIAALAHLQVDLASLTILQWDEKYEYFRLKLFNDTCHV